MAALAGALAGALAPRDDLATSPPPRRSSSENHPTLLVSWWATGCALVLILARLWGRLVRTERLFLEDKIMALSIIPLFARMGLIDPVMLWGTNNVDVAGISPMKLQLHSQGAMLVLPARIMYALFIWMAKFTVSEYLRRLTSTFWTTAHQRVLLGIRIFLVLTFIAVVIATLGECHPFNHYWQVVPDPGVQCRAGYAQLLVMSSCDIVTDILLVLFPISLIARSSMPLKRKLSISALFGLSTILIAITSYRVAAIIASGSRQQLRTLWASLEILAAAAVSNALILGSFVRDRGVKKSKYKAPPGGTLNSVTNSEPQSHIVRKMTIRHWGNDSDENLFSALRGRLDSVVEAEAGVHPAPLARGGRYRDDDTLASGSLARGDDGLGTPRESAEEVELMDIGGILDNSPKVSSSGGERTTASADSSTPLTVAGGTTAFDFADVGGLLSRPRHLDFAAAATSAPTAHQQNPPTLLHPPTRPENSYAHRAPLRPGPPPLSKHASTLSSAASTATTADGAPRRPSVASNGTDDSTGEARAVALDMLAKIREARERARAAGPLGELDGFVGASGDGRLFGETKPSAGLFESEGPG